MAIVLKKKPAPAPVQPTAPLTLPPVALSPREEEALEAVGLAPAKPKNGLVIKKKPKVGRFIEGQRLKITNEFYPWIKHWQPGDTGTVIRYNGPVQEAKGDLRYGLVILKLDTVRDKDRPTAYFHAWELAPLEEPAHG